MSDEPKVLHEWELAGYHSRIVETQPGIVSSEQAMDDDKRGRLWLSNRSPFGWQNEMIHLAISNESLASEVATLRKERDEAREVALDLIPLAADAAEKQNGDWACAECRPHSDMLKEGWTCSYHRALTFRARIASREGGR